MIEIPLLGWQMKKRNMIPLITLLVALGAICYAVYNSLSQLKDIDYDMFEEELEEEDF